MNHEEMSSTRGKSSTRMSSSDDVGDVLAAVLDELQQPGHGTCQAIFQLANRLEAVITPGETGNGSVPGSTGASFSPNGFVKSPLPHLRMPKRRGARILTRTTGGGVVSNRISHTTHIQVPDGSLSDDDSNDSLNELPQRTAHSLSAAVSPAAMALSRRSPRRVDLGNGRSSHHRPGASGIVNEAIDDNDDKKKKTTTLAAYVISDMKSRTGDDEGLGINMAADDEEVAQWMYEGSDSEFLVEIDDNVSSRTHLPGSQVSISVGSSRNQISPSGSIVSRVAEDRRDTDSGAVLDDMDDSGPVNLKNPPIDFLPSIDEATLYKRKRSSSPKDSTIINEFVDRMSHVSETEETPSKRNEQRAKSVRITSQNAPGTTIEIEHIRSSTTSKSLPSTPVSRGPLKGTEPVETVIAVSDFPSLPLGQPNTSTPQYATSAGKLGFISRAARYFGSYRTYIDNGRNSLSNARDGSTISEKAPSASISNSCGSVGGSEKSSRSTKSRDEMPAIIPLDTPIVISPTAPNVTVQPLVHTIHAEETETPVDNGVSSAATTDGGKSTSSVTDEKKELHEASPLSVDVATDISQSHSKSKQNLKNGLAVVGLLNHDSCDLASFLSAAHDYLVSLDGHHRANLLRVLRHCLVDRSSVDALIDSEIHWQVSLALEADSSCVSERVQALKLMDRTREVAPLAFPRCFGSSLVAIANCKEDVLRRLCMHSLCSLAAVNPTLVSSINGFATLMDGVSDPISPDSGELILRTLLKLLEDPHTRLIVAPCVDLKMFLAPLTDLDTPSETLRPRWEAAQFAFRVLMRSWYGIVALTGDRHALPFVTSVLRDGKVPEYLHTAILDGFEMVLQGVSETIGAEETGGEKKRAQRAAAKLDNYERLLKGIDGASVGVCGETIGTNISGYNAAYNNGRASSSSGMMAIGGLQYDRFSRRTLSEKDILKSSVKQTNQSTGVAHATSSIHKLENSMPLTRQALAESSSGNSTIPIKKGRSLDLQGDAAGRLPQMPFNEVSNGVYEKSSRNVRKGGGTFFTYAKHLKHALRGGHNEDEESSSVESGSSTGTRGFSLAALFGGGNRTSSITGIADEDDRYLSYQRLPPPKSATNGAATISVVPSSNIQSTSVTTATSMNAQNVGVAEKTRKVSKSRRLLQKTRHSLGLSKTSSPATILASIGNDQQSDVQFTPFKRTVPLESIVEGSVHDSVTHENGHLEDETSTNGYYARWGNDVDLAHNLVESYAALLVCSLQHIQLVEALYLLSTSPSTSLAEKSRQLLVQFLRVAATVLPEALCGDLLANQPLIATATDTSSRSMTISFKTGSIHDSTLHTSNHELSSHSIVDNNNDPNVMAAVDRACKASELLHKLAESFSLLPSSSSAPALIAFRPLTTNGMAISGGLQPRGGSPSGLSASFGRDGNGVYEIAVYAHAQSKSLVKWQSGEAHSIAPLPLSLTSSSNLDNSQSTVKNDLGAVLLNLQRLLYPSIDKQQLMKLMDQSRLTAKDGKDPTKWDWSAIEEILSDGLHSQDRLGEAIKAKWIRRFSAFFGLQGDEKIALFPTIDWAPHTLQPVSSGAQLFRSLLSHNVGLSFLLSNDKRNTGNIFRETTAALDTLLNPTSSSAYRASYSGGYGHSSSSAVSIGLALGGTGSSVTYSGSNVGQFSNSGHHKTVFRPQSLLTTLTREYFTLIALAVTAPYGREAYDSSGLHPRLMRLGDESPKLDYLCRVIFTSFAFLDSGIVSADLVRAWVSSPHSQASLSLRIYVLETLRLMIRSALQTGNDEHPYYWVVDEIAVILSEMDALDSAASNGATISPSIEGSVASNATITAFQSVEFLVVLRRLLSETLNRKSFLQRLLQKSSSKKFGRLLYSLRMRLVSVPEGIHRLAAISVMETREIEATSKTVFRSELDILIDDWTSGSACEMYVKEVEDRINRTLWLRPDEPISRMSALLPLSSLNTTADDISTNALSPSPQVNSTESLSTIPIVARVVRDLLLHLPSNQSLSDSPVAQSQVGIQLNNHNHGSNTTGGGIALSTGLPQPSVSGATSIGISTATVIPTTVPTSGTTSLPGVFSTSSNAFVRRQRAVVPVSATEGTVDADSYAVNLEGLVRLPWHIEAKLLTHMDTSRNSALIASNGSYGTTGVYGSMPYPSSTINYGSSGYSESTGQELPQLEYLTLDSYVDTSSFATPLADDNVSDADRIIRIRARVVDHTGTAAPRLITSSMTVSTSLLVGVCAVLKTGAIRTTIDVNPNCTIASRRRGSTVTTKESVSRGGAATVLVSSSGVVLGGTGTSNATLANSGSGATCNVDSGGFSSSGALSGGVLGSASSQSLVYSLLENPEVELPVTYGADASYEWISCRPVHRQSLGSSMLSTIRYIPDHIRHSSQQQVTSPRGSHSVSETSGNEKSVQQTNDSGNATVMITLNGEPVVLVFSRRRLPASLTGLRRRRASNFAASLAMSRVGASNSGGYGSAGFGSGYGSGSLLNNSTQLPFQTPTAATPSNGSVDNTPSIAWNHPDYGLYLVEIQYYLRITTGQKPFVPMPRHLFSELTRSADGCQILRQRNIASTLSSRARSLYDELDHCWRQSRDADYALKNGLRSNEHFTTLPLLPINSIRQRLSGTPLTEEERSTKSLELRSLLWSLGHLASTEGGLRLVLAVDPRFIHWCTDMVTRSPYFQLRITAFHLLGLLGRSSDGVKMLRSLGWEYSCPMGSAATALPRDPSILFTSVPGGVSFGGLPQAAMPLRAAVAISGTAHTFPYRSQPLSSLGGLTPFLSSTQMTVEQEILNLITKMPGVILYRDCKQRLEVLQQQYPDAFSSRSLFCDVMRVLESYSFRLTARREIVALFSQKARMITISSVN